MSFVSGRASSRQQMSFAVRVAIALLVVSWVCCIAVAQAGTGVLQVRAGSGFAVFVDGISRGETNDAEGGLVVLGVDVGERLVRVERDADVALEVSVIIRVGSVSLLDVDQVEPVFRPGEVVWQIPVLRETNNRGAKVSFAPTGQLYVAQPDVYSQSRALAYDASGNEIWLGGLPVDSGNRLEVVGVDGGVVLAYNLKHDVMRRGDLEAIVERRDPSGQLQWRVAFPPESESLIGAHHVGRLLGDGDSALYLITLAGVPAADDAGTVMATLFVWRLDHGGAVAWRRSIDLWVDPQDGSERNFIRWVNWQLTLMSTSSVVAGRFAVLLLQRVYVVGEEGSVNEWLASPVIEPGTAQVRYPLAIDMGSNNDVYVVYTGEGGYDAVGPKSMAVFDALGTTLRDTYDLPARLDGVTALRVFPSGAILLAGDYRRREALVMCLSREGDVMWTHRQSGRNDSYVIGIDVDAWTYAAVLVEDVGSRAAAVLTRLFSECAD